jgi:hypothetical protein
MIAVPVPKKRRRYVWTRINNDFPDLAIWRAAASIAKARVHQVVAVALRLDCVANKSVPRGSVADMSVPEFAAALQLPADTVARIRAALEDPAISWIDQDVIVDFYERNPDDCDPTAADRQRRHREKLRADRRELSDALSARPPPTDFHSNGPVTRDVTLRDVTKTNPLSSEDAARTRASGAPAGPSDERAGTSARVQSGESGESSIDPELWLWSEGRRIVIERSKDHPGAVDTRMRRWLEQELAGDAKALVEIIIAADRADYMGARFHNLIVDQIKRRVHQSDGQRSLPLPPAAVVGKKAVGE